MDEDITQNNQTQAEKWYAPLTRKTKFSKYFAMVLFVVLPFVGFLLGYKFTILDTDKGDISIPQACQADARICSDGSTVARTGPDCSFMPCPDEDVEYVGGLWPLHRTEVFWGPCPGPEGSCWGKTTLYNTGLYEVADYRGTTTYELGTDFIQAYESIVRDTMLRTKNCDAGEALDYWRTDTLYLREGDPIQFPGCEAELKQIDVLLETTLMDGVTAEEPHKITGTATVKEILADYGSFSEGAQVPPREVVLLLDDATDEGISIVHITDSGCVDENIESGSRVKIDGTINKIIPDFAIILSCGETTVSKIEETVL